MDNSENDFFERLELDLWKKKENSEYEGEQYFPLDESKPPHY